MDRQRVVANGLGVLSIVALHVFAAIVLTTSQLSGPPFNNLLCPLIVCAPIGVLWFYLCGHRHVRMTVFACVTLAALLWFVWNVVIPFRAGPYPLL
jgi:hypothetical protein